MTLPVQGGEEGRKPKGGSRRPAGGGWKAAAMGTVLCALAGALLVRTEGLPEPEGRRGGPRVRWGGDGGGLAERMVGEPTVFALGGAAGFTHRWIGERPKASLAPVAAESARAGAAVAGEGDGGAGPGWRPEWAKGGDGAGPRVPPGRAGSSAAVAAPPVPAVPGEATLEFGGEWTPRLFGGVDLDFGEWTAEGWTAEAEVEFDARGVPERVFLTERSGVDEVDKRLAREPWRWRLRDDGAARSGKARWRVPAGDRAGGTP